MIVLKTSKSKHGAVYLYHSFFVLHSSKYGKFVCWGVQGGSLSPFLLGMYKEAFMSTESSGARALAGHQQ